MGPERVRQSLSSLGSCVILKGMRSLLSTYQMMVFFLVCQIRSSSSTYLSGIGPCGCQVPDIQMNCDSPLPSILMQHNCGTACLVRSDPEYRVRILLIQIGY